MGTNISPTSLYRKSLRLRRTLNPRRIHNLRSTSSMADLRKEKLIATIKSQYLDDEKWAFNKRIIRAVCFFGTSVVLMRNLGDMMAV